MEPLSITVDLESFKPLSCSPEFTAMLGFSSERRCLGSFSRIAHFRGYNFFQLAQIAQTEECAQFPEAVAIIDNSFRVVGTLKEIKVDSSRRQMHILARNHQGERVAGPRYLPPAHLLLDKKLNIAHLDIGAERLFGQRICGMPFPDAIAPSGVRDRLTKIYTNRLMKHTRVRLDHRTRTARSQVDSGKWRITRQPDGSVKATFQPVADLDHEAERGALYLQPARNRIVIGRDWASRLGIEAIVDKRGLDAYLDAVLEEDTDLVRKLLLSRRLPEEHTLYYRLASADGRVIPVEHSLRVPERKSSTQVLAGDLQECQFNELKYVHLQTLAIDHDLTASGNARVQISNRDGLRSILTILKECIDAEQSTPIINMSTEVIEGKCSLCDSVLPSGLVSLVLTLPTYKPDRHELSLLPERDYSLTRTGEPAFWKSLFKLMHQGGHHVTIMSHADGSLVIKLTAQQDQDD